MKRFIGDSHFNHSGILKIRPQFSTVEEMNQGMIDEWNSVCKPGDLIYHLGDFAIKSKYGGAWDIDYILSQLKGQIILIRGNHDDKNMKKYESWFAKVTYLDYIKADDGSKIMLSHYPMRSWRASIHGSFHLHAHSHGKVAPYGRMQDCGGDVIGFAPKPWEPLKEMILKREQEMNFEYVQ